MEVSDLNRFQSKSTIHVTPLVSSTHKKCKKRRRETPLDYSSQKKAFTQLKAQIAALPSPRATEKGEIEGNRIEASVKTPLYFVSKALKEMEIHYSAMEKLILALVISKPDASGRLQKWSEFAMGANISYRPTDNSSERTDTGRFSHRETKTDACTAPSEVILQEPWILSRMYSSCVDGSAQASSSLTRKELEIHLRPAALNSQPQQ
ncbi:hypothetical protein Tco_0913859 [Tanacetum coccineum]